MLLYTNRFCADDAGVFVYTGQEDQVVPADVVKVKVQEGVTTIRERAFSYCSGLEKITFPASLESIEECAFLRCKSLAEVDLSSTDVRTIEPYAFSTGCTSMSSIKLPNTLRSIEAYAFCFCTSLVEVDLASTAVKTIGPGAFKNCTSMSSITLPKNLRSIEEGAFRRCASLVDIDIQQTTTRIGKFSFKECPSLASIVIPVSIQVYSNTFDEHTEVIQSNWFVLGPYLKVRELVANDRAIPIEEVEDRDLQILQYFSVHVCDDIFRTVLEMVRQEPALEIIEVLSEDDDFGSDDDSGSDDNDFYFNHE